MEEAVPAILKYETAKEIAEKSAALRGQLLMKELLPIFGSDAGAALQIGLSKLQEDLYNKNVDFSNYALSITVGGKSFTAIVPSVIKDFPAFGNSSLANRLYWEKYAQGINNLSKYISGKPISTIVAQTDGDIIQAEKKLTSSGLVNPVKLKYCTSLSRKYNANFYQVVEILQLVKSFKIRGACNKIMNLTPEQRKKGVICASAGNHAQGTAATATKLNIKSYICMPSNAPLTKINATKHFGGNVILAKEPSFDAAYALSKKLAKEKGYVEIPPYDDKEVIAGQATIALETLNQNPNIDTFIVPIGGGGMISGVAVCAKTINPNIKIIGVQAENFPAMKLSKQKGKIVSYSKGKPTLADGCAVKTPGNITFSIIKD